MAKRKTNNKQKNYGLHELNPKSMAVIHEKQVLRLSGEAGTSKARIDFKDGSYFTFQLNSADPQYRSWGENERTAFSYQFSNDVATFSIKQNGFTVVFRDNSKWDYDLTNATGKKV